jgi:hypothetical protein
LCPFSCKITLRSVKFSTFFIQFTNSNLMGGQKKLWNFCLKSFFYRLKIFILLILSLFSLTSCHDDWGCVNSWIVIKKSFLRLEIFLR